MKKLWLLTILLILPSLISCGPLPRHGDMYATDDDFVGQHYWGPGYYWLGRSHSYYYPYLQGLHYPAASPYYAGRWNAYMH